MRPFLLALAVAFAPLAHGQTLTVSPAKAPLGHCIQATLSNAPDLPAGAVDPQTTVTVENGEAKPCNATSWHLWARPGRSAVVWKRTAHVPEVETYFAPGPKFDPKNPKLEDCIVKTRVISDTQVSQTASATVEVEGAPEPTPTPPGPTPNPPDNFSAQVQAYLKALPAGAYSKDKALEVADNYLTVGSQGSDPARNQGWTAATFGEQMKMLNLSTLGADGVDAWREPFFRPLAAYQAKLVTDRGIAPTDVPKIAALWTETGEAIKAAAY